jgi:hypothetical protein
MKRPFSAVGRLTLLVSSAHWLEHARPWADREARKRCRSAGRIFDEFGAAREPTATGGGERMLWVARRPHRPDGVCLLIRLHRSRRPRAAPIRWGSGLGGTPFDMRGVELGHHEGRCSFETILHKYELRDPALDEIAAMVHDADLDDDRFRSPEAPGLDAIVRGLGLVIQDDHELLRFTDRVYDGLYAWLQRMTR